MKIAILGGSFDPPHLGHLLIAQQVKEILNMDQVLLMPLYQKTFQDKSFHKQLSPVAHRLSMTKILANDFIKVSEFEITQNKTSYSIDTLTALTKLHPADTFSWILGSDQLQGFQKYHRWQELVKTQNLIVFPREHMLWHLEERVKESLQLQTIPENVIVLQNKDLILTNISSTMIRERVRNNRSIQNIVSENVGKYIMKEKLYQAV